MEKGKLTISGLITDVNKWSSTPDGALTRATDIVIDRPNIATSRRGFLPTQQLSDPLKLYEFRDKVYCLDGTTLRRNDSGTWNSVGTLTPISSTVKPHSTINAESALFTSAEGIQVIDTATASLRAAGASPALEIRATAGAGSTLASSSYYRYRLCYAKTLDNGRLILSAPSYSVAFQATGANRTYTVDTSLPPGIDATWRVQLFRSLASPTDPASDELYLAIERPITAGEVTAGVVSVVDTTAETDLGVSLYTNPSLGGIAAAKYPPPLAHDVFTYQNVTFYCNTREKHQILLTMSTIPTAADTITLDGNVFTAGAAENIGTSTFLAATTIEETLNSLCRVINQKSGPTITLKARQLSETVILIERTTFAGASFTASTSVSAKVTFSNNGTSSNNEMIDGVYVSQILEPESVPLIPPPFRVGVSDRSILRGLGVRDAAFILKQDGVFRISGLTPETFQIEALDNTFEIVAAETAQPFANMIFCLTSRGVVAISSTSIDVVSEPVDNIVEIALGLSTLNQYAFGIAYDKDQRYLLGMPTPQSPTAVRTFLVFNGRTNTWTQWSPKVKHGLAITNSNFLRLIREDGYILEERKDFALSDYADDEYAVTITGVGTGTITLASASGLAAGMLIKQGAAKQIILSFSGNTLNVADSTGFTAAAATVYKPIPCEMAWSLEASENAGYLKHVQEATLLFEDARFDEFQFSTVSNFSPNIRTTTVLNDGGYGWGAFPWGAVLWGGSTGGPKPFRVLIHREHRRALWVNFRVTHSAVFSSFDFAGLTYQFEPSTRKFR